MIGFNPVPSALDIKISFISSSNLSFSPLVAFLPMLCLTFFTRRSVILSMSIIAFSATFKSTPICLSLFIPNSKASGVSGPLDLKGRDIHLSTHLSNGSVRTFPVPLVLLNFLTPAKAPPIAPVKAAPSKPNFNLFNNSVSGFPVSLSISVGPPNKSPNDPASSTSPTKIPSATPPDSAPLANLLTFSPLLKYVPASLALSAALVKPDPTLNASPPGIPMLTISSVILPAAVASAASSKGFIFAKYSSTASALSLSTPRSIRVAPNVAAPSKILKIPEPSPASID